MIALDDSALARILIGATRHEDADDRTALLLRFACVAERRPCSVDSRLDKRGKKTPLSTVAKTGSKFDPVRDKKNPISPAADQLGQMTQLSGGRAGGPPRPRSPDAERMRRYRARLRREIAIVPTPVSAATIGYLVRHGYLRGEREAYGREEIGRAIAAALERLAR
jgi:hypothetical protein